MEYILAMTILTIAGMGAWAIGELAYMKKDGVKITLRNFLKYTDF